MSQNALLVNLGHALIAAAWADGELTEDELQSLKDLLFRLPGLGAEDWRQLENRAEISVGEGERGRILESLRDSIRTADDRDLVLTSLDHLLHSDSGFGEPERAALQQMRVSIEARDVDVGLWSQLSSWFQSPLQRRVQATSRAGNPHQRATELHERIFYEVDERLAEERDLPPMDHEDLRRLCLAGAMMAIVAHVDEDVTEDEWNKMQQTLERNWDLSDKAARAVVEVAVVHGESNVDTHRALRELFELTSEKERQGLLDILFDVAAADGQVSHHEMEEIRHISLGLKLPHSDFIAAKTRVPDDLRAH